MNPNSWGVKGTPTYPRIPFAFRAEPVALDGMKIPSSARRVFTLLLDNAKNRGWKSRLSNGTMARILGCCEMTVGRALVALEKAGLIRRELIAGGRVRLAIHVTWDGVQQPVRPCVQQSCGTGSTAPSKGSNSPAGHTSVPPQSEKPDGPGSLSGGGEKIPNLGLSGPAAADYLRQCVEAAKAGRPMPEFPDLGKTQPTGGCTVPPPSPKGIPIQDTPTPTPAAPPDAFLPSVGRMVASLGERLKAESVGNRRVGPKRLAAQLAEVRRRHGRRE